MQPWIKMRTDLDQTPEVMAICAGLNEDAYTVIGRLWKFWAWVEANCDNGHIPVATYDMVDRLIGKDRFADMLEHVGWISHDDRGIVIPEHDKHMGAHAREKARKAENQKRYRERSRSGNAAVTKRSLEERRGDKSRGDKSSPSPAARVSDDQAGEIYDLYPRKAGRKAAIPKIKQAIVERGFDAIRDAVQRYARSPAGNRGKYTPHPATWFGQGRYDDDPETWNLKDEQHDHRTDKASREFDESDLTVPVLNERSLRTGT